MHSSSVPLINDVKLRCKGYKLEETKHKKASTNEHHTTQVRVHSSSQTANQNHSSANLGKTLTKKEKENKHKEHLAS